MADRDQCSRARRHSILLCPREEIRSGRATGKFARMENSPGQRTAAAALRRKFQQQSSVSSVACEAFTGWPCALRNLWLLLNAVRVPLGGQALQPKITTLLHVWAIRCASADNRTDSRCLARSPLVAHKAARVRASRGSSCALSRCLIFQRRRPRRMAHRTLLGRV